MRVGITPVATIKAVAIVVAVLALRHVDAIKHHAGLGQLLFGCQRVYNLNIGFVRIVGTAHIAAYVGVAGYLQRVGNKAHRGGIDNDIAVFLTQDFSVLLSYHVQPV